MTVIFYSAIQSKETLNVTLKQSAAGDHISQPLFPIFKIISVAEMGMDNSVV